MQVLRCPRSAGRSGNLGLPNGGPGSPGGLLGLPPGYLRAAPTVIKGAGVRLHHGMGTLLNRLKLFGYRPAA